MKYFIVITLGIFLAPYLNPKNKIMKIIMLALEWGIL